MQQQGFVKLDSGKIHSQAEERVRELFREMPDKELETFATFLWESRIPLFLDGELTGPAPGNREQRMQLLVEFLEAQLAHLEAQKQLLNQLQAGDPSLLPQPAGSA